MVASESAVVNSSVRTCNERVVDDLVFWGVVVDSGAGVVWSMVVCGGVVVGVGSVVVVGGSCCGVDIGEGPQQWKLGLGVVGNLRLAKCVLFVVV